MGNGGGAFRPPPSHPAPPTPNRSSEWFDFGQVWTKSSFITFKTLTFEIGQELGGPGPSCRPAVRQKIKIFEKNFFFLYNAAKFLFLKIEGWKMNT